MIKPEPVSLTIDYEANQTLDAAFAARNDLEELNLINLPPGAVLPEQLKSLPHLKVLSLNGKDNALQVPALVAELNIKRLELYHAKASELPPLPLIKQIYLVTDDAQDAVPVLLDRAPQLHQLELHFTRWDRMLPDAIGDFQNLRVLMLKRCGLTTLPNSFSNLPLEELVLIGNSFTTIPEVVCRLTKLKRLVVEGEPLAKLPDELANLTALKELSLCGSLNHAPIFKGLGAENVKDVKDIPAIIASLTPLEKLDLSACGVRGGTNFTKICSSLTNLKTLKLGGAGLTSLKPLASLTQLKSLWLNDISTLKSLVGIEGLGELEDLSLYCTRIGDITHLDQLKALKTLDVRYLKQSKQNWEPIYDLDVEFTAHDDFLEKRKAYLAKRDALRGVPTFELLIPKLNTTDPVQVAKTFEQLILRSAAVQGRKSPLLTALTRFKPCNPLLDALDQHRENIDPLILGKLFGEVVRNLTTNASVALKIASEVQKRGDDAAQLALVEGFKQAYDGTRSVGTLLDRLIDEVFPVLGSAAQTELLTWKDSEGMLLDLIDTRCFGPALARATVEQRENLVEHLVKRLKYIQSPPSDLPRFNLLLATISAAGPAAQSASEIARARLTEFNADAKRPVALKEDLASLMPERVASALTVLASNSELAKEIPLWDAFSCRNLPLDAVRSLVKVFRIQSGDELVGYPFAKGVETHSVEDLTDIARELGLADLDFACLLRATVIDLKYMRINAWRADEITLQKLRDWVSTLPGMTPLEAKSTEVRDTFAYGFRHYNSQAMADGISALAEIEAFTPISPDNFAWSDFASAVAQMTEGEERQPLKLLVRHLHKLPLPEKSKERVLAMLIGVCSVENDAEGLKLAISLAPEVPKWNLLAFNLACVAARSDDRHTALKHMRRALELGWQPAKFLSDSDFKHLQKENEFKALLVEFGGEIPTDSKNCRKGKR